MAAKNGALPNGVGHVGGVLMNQFMYQNQNGTAQGIRGSTNFTNDQNNNQQPQYIHMS
jgi:hypothetical protein